MDIRRTITLGDVLNKQRAAYSTMIKPVGSLCNLDCHYCYYLDKANLYPQIPMRLDDALLEKYIAEYIQSNEIPVVTFVWHGGEPLLAGLEFYKKALAFQQKYCGEKKIENALQTNGLLLNESWCDFFVQNHFLIGISLDGPRQIHDAYRVDKGGHPTFDRVVAAIALLKAKGVEFNVLTAVHKQSEGRGKEVYLFLKSLGVQYMQFLPVLEHVCRVENITRPVIVSPDTENSELAAWSVSAAGFGKFMTDIFDYWVLNDVGRYYVQLFDVALAQWAGVPPGLCSFEGTCGNALVVEHNGDVYSCDHFVYPEHRLGNIQESSLVEMLKSQKQFGFGVNKRNTLPPQCLRCKYYFACRGECPKHRFEKTKDGVPGLNALCRAYYTFFEHVDPYMVYMKQCLDRQMPPSMVMAWARERMGFKR